ncbi:MAG: hypothetical protein KIT68_13460, partial [Phycisphaeraceae bacterium]|nr:hypothetical protein [Phycisphaeraceae bacterium]
MKTTWKYSALALFLAAGTAQAQVWNETANGGGDAGELTGTAQVTALVSSTLSSIVGTLSAGTDGDMYKIQICDFANFSASLVGGASFDSQLFLFSETGLGVLHNDDTGTPQSAIDNLGGQITANGQFFIAVTSYNRDPLTDAAQLIWNNTPFTGVRAPDGPGAAAAVGSWSGGGGSGAYTLTLGGTCPSVVLTSSPPTIIPSLATPANAFEAGRTVLFTATVTPGTGPASTTLTVRADLGPIGGSATQLMYDDATNGDEFANDGVYSYAFAVPSSQPGGPVSLTFSVTDQVPRTSSASINLNLFPRSWNESLDGGGDAGDLPSSAQVPTGTNPFQRITGEITTGDVDMYAINICDAPNFSASTLFQANWDTQLFLFRADGVGVLSEDDSPGSNNGLETLLQNTSIVTATGPHYLAISRFNSDPRDASAQFLWAGDNNTAPTGPGAANPVASWSIATTVAGPYGITMTGVCYFDPLAPTPPTISAAATGLFEQTRSVLLTATVGSGTNPASTSYTVTVDLSQVGGSGTQAMYDDGSNGDLVLGDGTYSYAHTIPGSSPLGAAALTYTVTDQVPRSSSVTLNRTVAEKSWSELVDGGDDAGDLPATAQVPTGADPFTRIVGTFATGSDVDMYRINICDLANYSVTTVGGTTNDTQLFLFNTDGTGVLVNDDSTGTQSTFNSFSTVVAPNAGDYYLAVTTYNIDPQDENFQFMWENLPFNSVRAPDGPGAAGVVSGWVGTGGAGTYTVTMVGICYPT